MKACHAFIISLAFLASSVMGYDHSRSRNFPCENYYEEPCHEAEEIVRKITWNRTSSKPALAAKLLRMHFHDCFVRGCDGSILLDSTEGNTAEKEAIPNLSLDGFDVIDEIKTELEKQCPGIVSCADILALAARDSVSFLVARNALYSRARKPLWKVHTGRKDGKVSKDTEVLENLPGPSDDFSTLSRSFANKGLNARDLVVLSGGHTIGIGHCNLFSNRLYNFTGKGDQDPSLNPEYATFLKTKCPNLAATSEVDMDFESAESFDSHYFVTLKQKMGMFQSDAALLTNPLAREFVNRLANPVIFWNEFSRSMEKMGAIGVLTSGEIRKNCRVVNRQESH